MLYWSKVLDKKTFQRFVNYLFVLEYDSLGFIPCSSFGGCEEACEKGGLW